MLTTFFVGLFWILYVYAGYIALLAWVGRGRRVTLAPTDTHTPFVSVLIAARNEARDIAWKLEETLAWDYPADRLEILVASDHSDDATDAIVGGYTGERVRLFRLERRSGKARALNQLAGLARGEVLFFTDANAHIRPLTLRMMARHFADARVGCVTGSLDPVRVDHAPIADGAQVYWGYEGILRRLENRVGSVLVCDGAIFCLRASLFQPLDPELANDLESPMRVGAAGYWVVHEAAARVVERETSSVLEEFHRRRRISAQGMLAMRRLGGTLRGLRGWQFVTHKFLRWLTLVPMLMVLVSSAVLAARSTFFATLCAIQVLSYACAAVGMAAATAKRGVARVFSVPAYAILGVIGALVGVLQCLAGKRFDIWETPSLSRGPIGATLRPPV